MLRLAWFGTMKVKHPARSIRERLPSKALAIVAVLVFALFGCLFHHHESAPESAACSYCQAGVQTPVIDLAGALVATTSAVLGFVTPARPSRLPRVVRFLTLVPRAPPATTHPVAFWEGCAGPV